MTIHPSALVSKKAVIGTNNDIGPNVIIEDDVVLGSDNKIWANACICSGTRIGNRNQIHMGAVIGHIPQDLAYQGAPTETRIGSGNIFREYVTIHRGTKEGTATTIGDNNFLMANVHIAHNCEIGSRVIMVNGAGLAGYCKVEDEAFLSGMTVFHQFTTIGRLAMISALSAINRDVPPFVMVGGRGAIAHGINSVGMKRAGIAASTREEIKLAFKLLYRSDLNVSQALEEIERSCSSSEAKHLVNFIKNSKRGICGGRERDTEALRF